MPLYRVFIAILTFFAIAASPAAATGGQQVPWDRSALTSDFHFQPAAGQRSKEAAQPAARAPVKLARATTMADLDALAASGSWAELYGRLTDIAPAKRDAHWNSLVEQAALGELGQQTAPGGFPAERLAAIERYYPKFPALAKSDKFLALRTKIGLEAFARCFEIGDGFQCRTDFERFVFTAPVTAELALGAAHVIGVGLNRQVAAVFYEAGLDAPGGQAICTDSELQYDLLRGLELPPEYREAKAARNVMTKCWEQVKGAVAGNAAKETGESYFMHNACPALLEHNSLTGLMQKRCQAIKQ
jgi:hypothetical protein